MTRARWLAALGAAALLAACTTGGGVPADGQGGGDGETISVFDLAVGDCFNSEAEDNVEEVERIDCASPHTYELYHAVDHPGGDEYPGTDVLDEFADAECRSTFEDFVGIPYDDSELFFFSLRPSEGTWAAGDREVLCSVFLPDEMLTGSMDGSQR